MSDIKSDLKRIEEVLASKSSFGNFSVMNEPEFKTLECMFRQASETLAKYQFVCKKIEASVEFYRARLNAMIEGEKIDDSFVEACDEQIAVFWNKLKGGVDNVFKDN